MKLKGIGLALAGLWICTAARAVEAPKLVVNIVVSQMRYDYLSRFGDNLSEDGFRRFMREGVVFSQSYYDYMQTTTEAALATLTTGTNPSTHGITSERWIDYVTGKSVDLIADERAAGLECNAEIGCFSSRNLIVPTLADRLLAESPASKVITVAIDPASAVVMGGHTSQVFWMDVTRCKWISSTAYMERLPEWVARYNTDRRAETFLDKRWSLSKPQDRYVNNRYTVFDFKTSDFRYKMRNLDVFKTREVSRNYPQIVTMPSGNTLVAEFAREAIIREDLGKDDHVDLLNVCFDTPRWIGEAYGTEAMETEDMIYRLDGDLAAMMAFIDAQFPDRRVLYVLTSDHGASDSYDADAERPRERFNADQFKVVVNSFLTAQYGPGNWVLDYVDRQLYLNRTLVYSRGLSLEDVQNQVAAFVLQFRGVSHVLTSTAMQNSYFGGSYAQKIQNSFYPKRSGDLTVNLMPGWIEEDDGRRSQSGSMYDYDSHVPFMVLGCGLPTMIVERQVDMTSLAPTLARIMKISRPIASSGEPIGELTGCFD